MKASRLFASTIFIFLMTGFVHHAHAATINVSTTNDVINSTDGFCSLREAVIAANTNAASGLAVGECPAGDNGSTDTINLAANQTYSLTIDGADEDSSVTGDLDIADNTAALDLILNGNG